MLRKTYVQPQEVMLLKANINYTEFHFENGEVLLISKTLKSFQNTFHQYGFVRINKSDMINVQYLTSTRAKYSYVTLTNNLELSVSRRRRKDVKNMVLS
ncbi:MAG: LytTR family transcriptional regulator [Spirosomaceae bacterium]|nr:LytTR family transcriptional regulator [Spirosomataceae bacterium]